MTTDIAALVAEARERSFFENFNAEQDVYQWAEIARRLADALESLIKEMHARELHHFETEKLLVEAGIDPDATAPATDDDALLRGLRDRIQFNWTEHGDDAWWRGHVQGMKDAVDEIERAGFRRSARVPVSRDELTYLLWNEFDLDTIEAMKVTELLDSRFDIYPKADRKPADSGTAAGPVGSGEEARASDHESRTAGRQLESEHQPSSPARQQLSADSGEAGL